MVGGTNDAMIPSGGSMSAGSISRVFLILLLPATFAQIARGSELNDPILEQVGAAVENFHSVDTGHIYRGARPELAGLEALAHSRIKTIVDLQGGDRIYGYPTEAGESDTDILQEKILTKTNGMAFFNEPMSAINPDMDDESGRIDEVLEMISSPENQPVFFHCRHGSDRTGLIAALYRVFYQACTPTQARVEMLKYGHAKELFWIDLFFRWRVLSDPRTHANLPGPNCPLN
jgi:tyrosine-protein phosphatase SIW14